MTTMYDVERLASELIDAVREQRANLGLRRDDEDGDDHDDLDKLVVNACQSLLDEAQVSGHGGCRLCKS